MTKILLLEDDPVLSKEVSEFLKSQGFDCNCVFDGEIFFRQLKNNSYQIFLLDINVPKLNGLDVCKKIREDDKTTPILMLTAYGDLTDKMDAFKLGADDYLVKPFHLEELHIRILSLLRRSSVPQNSDEIITIDDLEINTSALSVKRSETAIELTQKEYQLLLLLAKAKGRVLSKQSISEQLWDVHFDTNLNTIEVYINFLRKKIDRNFEHKLIRTRPGFGYYLKSE
ncbi:DNA-binding response regulator [Flavobacterium noncentrifugens]|uniref:DNA-binding response regulator, OmpR family, contains REC and winged-helix (WHTH) domain n=1 Tax=Flavobacterium noncentrifugens TaxID=1128970 RepID=A0A1G8RBZ6_9FLAO|nr:response regulator transcription factor [Flavobacterium noncentrifugens]GEP49359.1 DNA-binding response regulator [Flavobacterium noncentrifugens]SDJ14055.1 DNA-binding response regulator, OmpR family, contains REC and winged-helix (wHTH) domain [Flavobacterium noncentrifugens]